MSLPRKEHQSAARSHRHVVSQREPDILALCTAHFGGTRPPSVVVRRQSPPRKIQKRTLGSNQHRRLRKTAATTGGPLRDPQTTVSSREIALAWKAEYRAQCCSRTPCRPRKALKDWARALGFHFAVGPGVAGVGSWLGAGNHSPLAQQFAGVGLLVALRGGGGSAPSSSRPYLSRPLRYTPPRSVVSSAPCGEGSQPGTGGDAVAPADEHSALKRLAALDEPPPGPMNGGPSTPALAALLAAVLSDSSSSRNSSPLPDIVSDDTGSEVEDEARPHDVIPKMPPPRPEISLRTAHVPAARPQRHEPVTPVRERAAKPAFSLLTPPPSVGRL